MNITLCIIYIFHYFFPVNSIASSPHSRIKRTNAQCSTKDEECHRGKDKGKGERMGRKDAVPFQIYAARVIPHVYAEESRSSPFRNNVA